MNKVISAAQECAPALGLSSLSEEESLLLNNRDMAGPRGEIKFPFSQVAFRCPRLNEGMTVTPIWIGESEWLVSDCGDTIPLLKKRPYIRSAPGKLGRGK